MRALRLLPFLLALVAFTAQAQSNAEWSGGAPEAEAPAMASGGGPINDGAWHAEPIWAPGVYTGSNVGATNGAGLPNDDDTPAACTFNGPSNDSNLSVWWLFNPTTSGDVTIDLDGSDFDTVLQVIALTTFDITAGDVVACNDDDPTNGSNDFTSALTAPVVAGQLYLVRVTSYQADTGAIQMTVSGAPISGPPNDRLTTLGETGDILALRDEGLYPDSNVGATAAPNEPVPSCHTVMTNTVWRFFVPPADATVTIDLTGSDFDTKLGLFRVESNGTLAEVGCDDDSGTGTASRIETAVAGGTAYLVQIAGFSSAEGRILLDYSLADPPPPTAGEEGPEDALSFAAPVPNPAAGTVRLAATLASPGAVRVEVFDALGRSVGVLADGPAPSGTTTWTWDAAGQPAGVYAVRLTGEAGARTRTVSVVR